MTVQEFEEKQQMYNELQDAKKQYEKSKELMEYATDLAKDEHATVFNIYKTFDEAIIHISNSYACSTRDTWKVVFNMLTNLTELSYQLEERRYKRLLADFEK